MTLDDEDITDAPLDVTAGNITGVRVVLTDKLTGLLEQGREWDPNFQKQLRDAGRDFALRDGETLTLDLKMSTVTY